ncbi:exodeoxyribonuclease VII large subunit [Irregularibacter muris]|uniref:Exodeoxyribonuclease 7 large subunit n=2 Tax=Irregularibacter muris TaxID=1796619 RepID=A0AAE3HEM2_9FIRM|nr:exodeoxyribonuclease VII large subunit [Irregularibacter muris]MCR1897999.1 exodeoxyribonuclease VII large subunit [Irregularibacter muris]
MKMKTFNVSEVNDYINRLLSIDVILNNLQVVGEISNFKFHSSGHMYFTLKDKKSRIRCVMFNSYCQDLKFMPEDGMRVIIKGYISVYERDGQYQLYAQQMQPDGIGSLYLAFEQLKQKLELEGLFDDHIKKPIPFLPKTIGVITSATGAAVRDIISVITRRNPNVEIVIFHVLVQGTEASGQLAKAIEFFNKENNVDVIIIGRGGGSIEELWAFNEEKVARSIAASKIPIISAVGHETDFTIADFVADMRAATPSAAAELAIPPKLDLQYNIAMLKQRLIQLMKGIINNNNQKLKEIERYYNRTRLLNLLNQYKQQMDWINVNLIREMNKRAFIERERFQSGLKQLQSISPLAVLNRGFGMVKNQEDKLIVSIEEVEKGESIQILMKNGSIYCKVEGTEKGGYNFEG